MCLVLKLYFECSPRIEINLSHEISIYENKIMAVSSFKIHPKLDLAQKSCPALLDPPVVVVVVDDHDHPPSPPPSPPLLILK